MNSTYFVISTLRILREKESKKDWGRYLDGLLGSSFRKKY